MRRLFTVAFVRTDATKVFHLLTIDEVLLGSKFIVNECFGLATFLMEHYRAILVRRQSKAYDVRMLDWAECQQVEHVEDKVSGAWVFRGTRIPVRALFENLESGASVDQFLEWFPGVTHEQVTAVLEHAEKSLVEV